MVKGIVVAGTASGCGKTSVSLGLMAALKRREMTVQPYKVGPDFIDPGHHALVTSRTSHNLDGWMCGPEATRALFSRTCWDADTIVVEGVMGLFDGFSGSSEEGSTSQIAKWLRLPVLLVVDARSMARSAAAMVKGFAEFDPDLALAGVVFNNVASANHQSLLAEAMSALPHIPVSGFLARREDITTPSRHLGLVTAGEHPFSNADMHRLADWIEDGLDLDSLMRSLPPLLIHPPRETEPPSARVRIGVARDEAFCFYYEENLRLLAEAGAEVVPFSPLRDESLPPGLDGLYIGGGYPELHARDLAQNADLRRQIRAFCAAGHPVYAECGGFMYLMESLVAEHGQSFPMVGVFPYRSRMGKRFSALGYRRITTTRDSILGPAGTVARGHEFHYSGIPDDSYSQSGLFHVEDRRGPMPRAEGFSRNNVVASYIHLHLASCPDVARHFVAACTGAAATVS